MPGPLGLPIAIGAAGVAADVWSGLAGNRSRRKEARRDRRFQERMSSTQWQRGIADMEAAGMNPALAYQQGGASSPSGAMAQQTNVGEGSVASAAAVKMQAEQMAVMNLQKQKLMAETITERNRGDVAGVEAREAKARQQLYFTSSGGLTPKMRELLSARHGAMIANSARSTADASVAQFSIAEQKAISDLFENVGQGGAGARQLMPLLLQLMRGRR